MIDQPSFTEANFDSSSQATPAASIDGTLPPNWKYEETVIEIEAIIQQIETGELELAQVFDQFSIAVQRLRQCEVFLTRQQQKVDLIIETLMDDTEAF